MNRILGKGGPVGTALLVVLALLFGASTPSAASAYTLAYTGTVTSADGVFLALGAVPGDSVSGTVTIDPLNESLSSSTHSFNTFDEPIDFTFHLIHSGSLDLTLSGSASGSIGSAQRPGNDLLEYSADNSTTSIDLAFSNDGTLTPLTSLAGLPTSTSALMAMLPGDSPVASGSFSLNGFGTVNFNIALAATPIPATLPLFVSALGGLGFVTWRRRKADGGIGALSA